MTQLDRFGAPVSHDNAADIAVLGAAAELMLGYAPDPVGMIKDVLKTAPDFIMARCFLAGVYLTSSDQRRLPAMRRQLDILKTQWPKANDREQQHISALTLWDQGDLYGSSQAYADILNAYPRDLIALQVGHQTDFLLGCAASNRDRPARVLRHWSQADPQFSYVLGMQAFGMEESGHYAQAQTIAEKAVSLNAKDTWAVHALAHCLEMQGKVDEGITFMTNCEAHWGHDTYMSVHNRWHMMLYYIERAEFDRALAVHDQFMSVTPKSELQDAHDSVALLQRLTIAGIDVGDRWESLADYYAPIADQTYMSFTGLHSMIAFTAAGRLDAAQHQIAALEHAAAHDTGTIGDIIRMAGLPLVKGFQAYGIGDFKSAKRHLAAARHSSRIIGGSDAQRDVINLTLLDAALKDRDTGMARALLSERTVLKPHSPLVDLFAARAA